MSAPPAVTDEAQRASPGGAGLHVQRSDGVVRLVLDRPPLNVLDIPLLEALDDALRRADRDPVVKVVVLAAAGRAFCAGVDVADHAPDRLERMLSAFHSVITRLLAMRPPVVAAVHGAALGGGCELLLAADVVLAREGAKLGQPEVQLGVFPPAALALLPRLVGRQKALDLVLTGRVIGAEEAATLGLVTRLIAAADFDDEVEAYSSHLASLSGAVLQLTKRTLLEATELPLAAALAHVDSLYAGELMRLRDAREGLSAFTEKRPPVWKEA